VVRLQMIGTELSLTAEEARGMAFDVVPDPRKPLGPTVAVVSWSEDDRVPLDRIVMAVNGAPVSGKSAAQLVDLLSAARPPVSLRVSDATIDEHRHNAVAMFYDSTGGVDLTAQSPRMNAVPGNQATGVLARFGSASPRGRSESEIREFTSNLPLLVISASILRDCI
jgi:hypothetical protein